MSYTVFALKWRPKNFDEIVGQGHIVTQLKNAIEKDRVAHAYLFSGPRGVGKTSTARIFARALNCKNGPTAEPCGTCAACKDIAAGRSLDVIEIDGASNRGIDEIRVLRENVKFSPTAGKFKVYIIDEVHQITTDGFNALLKTLEEPPEFVKFIFATTQPQKVPATILSRCQRLDFRRISVLEVIAQLEKITRAEGVSVDKEVLFAIGRSCDGALRDAESILDQVIAYARDKVLLGDVTAMLGLVEQSTLFEIADAIIRKDPGKALRLLDEIIDQGKDPSVLVTDLITHFRNLMVAKVAQAQSKLIDVPESVCERLLEQARGLRMEEIFTAITVLTNAQEMAKRLESLRIPLEIGLVKLCSVASKPSDQKVPEKPAIEDRSPAPGNSAGAQPRPAAPASAQAPVQKKQEPDIPPARDQQLVSLEAVKECWHAVIQNIAKIRMSVATYLREGEPVKIANNVLTISFSRNHSLHKEALERKDNRTVIEQHLSDLVRAGVRVNFVLSQEEKPDAVSADNPAVQSALDMFNARLVKEE